MGCCELELLNLQEDLVKKTLLGEGVNMEPSHFLGHVGDPKQRAHTWAAKDGGLLDHHLYANGSLHANRPPCLDHVARSLATGSDAESARPGFVFGCKLHGDCSFMWCRDRLESHFCPYRSTTAQRLSRTAQRVGDYLLLSMSAPTGDAQLGFKRG